MSRQACRSLLISMVLLAGISTAGQMDEYSIKAGYLYNFSKYVEWPQQAFAAPSSPFVICIAGEDPFGSRLDDAIAGKTSGDGRPLEVRRLSKAEGEALRKCQMVFISKSEKRNAASLVEALRNSSIFTVADFTPFAENGGVANLRIDGSKVRVDLNMSAATRANLKVSGKLQQVSNLVN